MRATRTIELSIRPIVENGRGIESATELGERLLGHIRDDADLFSIAHPIRVPSVTETLGSEWLDGAVSISIKWLEQARGLVRSISSFIRSIPPRDRSTIEIEVKTPDTIVKFNASIPECVNADKLFKHLTNLTKSLSDLPERGKRE